MPSSTIYRCVLFTLAAILSMPATAQTSEDEVHRLTAENQELREQVATLTAELQALREALGVLQQDHVELAEETESLEQQVVEQKAQAKPAIDDRALRVQAERVTSEYDEAGDRTAVNYGPEELEVEGSPGDFYFSIQYGHPGAEPMAVEQATLFLQAYHAGRYFGGRETFEFFINGEPEPLTITGYELTPRKTGLPGRTRTDRSDEIVEFKLNRATLARLGEARSLTAGGGRVVVTFDQDDIAGIRAMAHRMRGE